MFCTVNVLNPFNINKHMNIFRLQQRTKGITCPKTHHYHKMTIKSATPTTTSIGNNPITQVEPMIQKVREKERLTLLTC